MFVWINILVTWCMGRMGSASRPDIRRPLSYSTATPKYGLVFETNMGSGTWPHRPFVFHLLLITRRPSMRNSVIGWIARRHCNSGLILGLRGRWLFLVLCCCKIDWLVVWLINCLTEFLLRTTQLTWMPVRCNAVVLYAVIACNSCAIIVQLF